MKKFFAIAMIAAALTSCGGGETKTEETTGDSTTTVTNEATAPVDSPATAPVDSPKTAAPAAHN